MDIYILYTMGYNSILLYLVAQIIPDLSIKKKLKDLPKAKGVRLILFCFWFFPLVLPVVLFFFKLFYWIFFHFHLVLLYSPLHHNHHTVVCVHEPFSFLLSPFDP